MKIWSYLVSVTYGGELYKSCQSRNNKIRQGSVQNGQIQCKGASCSLQCNPGYSTYGGYTKAKCINNRKSGKNSWSRSKLGACRTCAELQINHQHMQMDCSFTSSGMKKCIISCNNKEGIKPMNNDKVVAVCKCTFPFKSSAERDGKCHWRVGVDKIIDSPNFPKDYVKNWFCVNGSKNTSLNHATLGLSHATAESSSPHRIPPGLVCRNTASIDRIVGGVAAFPNSWPWIVNMEFGKFLCGGTILDDTTVVTAAHCCDGYQRKPKHVKGTIADHNFHQRDLGEETFYAEKVIVHPNYSRRTVVNDICIVKFRYMNIKVRPLTAAACLPPQGYHPPAGTKCWTAGWGYTDEGKVADKLQEVDLNIINDEKCKRTENGAFLIPGSMFCAGSMNGGKDACQGDSGGPLICVDSMRQPVLTGVTSWGIGCGKANSPGVWTKVSSYIPWIRSHMMKSQG